jgi:predicted PurR-regulated permease PerM
MSTPAPPPRLTSNAIVCITCVLALLYWGRDVLQPIALASILSLIVAPLVRRIGRLGLGRAPAMVAALLLVCACVAGTGAILAAQLASVTAELPQYRAAIRHKADTLRELATRPFAQVEAELKLMQPLAADGAARTQPEARNAAAAADADAGPAHPAAGDLLARLLTLARTAIGEAGMVLVLLVFILWERESLQDRLLRLTGQGEVSRTIRALADAAQGVSRFFLSQFIVNACFGAALGVALAAAGIPHALLWGILGGTLRFIPYLGVLAAGAATMVFVAAVDPGWSLTLVCMALFGALELIVAHVVEPKVYGHSTGLSPLAVVISALFWGALWGPVGLLISTPLTVCLVVAGRHVRALEPLTVLLGETPNVTAAQRFFQRALSGDTDAILRDAGAFLQRSSFVRYCDHVLLPGLALAAGEWRVGQIDAGQQGRIRSTVADVAETLAPSSASTASKRRRHRVSLLDANVGAHLRKLREDRLGRWQGSLDVPLRSIVLCAGLASERDDLVGELLARALRESGIDARSVVLPLPYEEHAPDKAGLISTVFIPYPLAEQLETWTAAVAALRALLPQVLVVTTRPPPDECQVHQSAVQSHVDMVLRSFEEGLAFVAPDNTKTAQ